MAPFSTYPEDRAKLLDLARKAELSDDASAIELGDMVRAILEDEAVAIASAAPEPAFPSVCLGDPGHPASVPGMSVRDWFAGQALAGFMASTRRPTTIAADDATWCFTVADAMLTARVTA